MNRTQALETLLYLKAPLADAKAALASFPWDSDTELVTLKVEHIANVLTEFKNDAISAEAVEDWANSLESREDVAYTQDEAVGRALHELANPHLTQALTRKRADELLGQLHEG